MCVRVLGVGGGGRGGDASSELKRSLWKSGCGSGGRPQGGSSVQLKSKRKNKKIKKPKSQNTITRRSVAPSRVLNHTEATDLTSLFSDTESDLLCSVSLCTSGSHQDGCKRKKDKTDPA